MSSSFITGMISLTSGAALSAARVASACCITGGGQALWVLAAGVPAQARGLGIPPAQRPGVLGLFLPKGIAEVVEETVGIALGKALEELDIIKSKNPSHG